MVVPGAFLVGGRTACALWKRNEGLSLGFIGDIVKNRVQHLHLMYMLLCMNSDWSEGQSPWSVFECEEILHQLAAKVERRLGDAKVICD